jgi:hypothetical protein
MFVKLILAHIYEPAIRRMCTMRQCVTIFDSSVCIYQCHAMLISSLVLVGHIARHGYCVDSRHASLCVDETRTFVEGGTSHVGDNQTQKQDVTAFVASEAVS